MRKWFLVLSLAIGSTSISAQEEECLQVPERKTACPHMIYKRVMVTKGDGSKEPRVQCICLSDFAALLKEPETETERAMQRMELSRLSARFGMQPKEFLELIQY